MVGTRLALNMKMSDPLSSVPVEHVLRLSVNHSCSRDSSWERRKQLLIYLKNDPEFGETNMYVSLCDCDVFFPWWYTSFSTKMKLITYVNFIQETYPVFLDRLCNVIFIKSSLSWEKLVNFHILPKLRMIVGERMTAQRDEVLLICSKTSSRHWAKKLNTLHEKTVLLHRSIR